MIGNIHYGTNPIDMYMIHPIQIAVVFNHLIIIEVSIKIDIYRPTLKYSG